MREMLSAASAPTPTSSLVAHDYLLNIEDFRTRPPHLGSLGGSARSEPLLIPFPKRIYGIHFPHLPNLKAVIINPALPPKATPAAGPSRCRWRQHRPKTLRAHNNINYNKSEGSHSSDQPESWRTINPGRGCKEKNLRLTIVRIANIFNRLERDLGKSYWAKGIMKGAH
ncbi:hypothetical protein HAX54_025812 [Datura stramonium]|uniref:Uncharacterized protein n=1 Tax=Datura stramonium TaxID=4076 RepID=A0ABS8V030_DATST|nr:hypothetical protein [Datura stramonium]